MLPQVFSSGLLWCLSHLGILFGRFHRSWGPGLRAQCADLCLPSTSCASWFWSLRLASGLKYVYHQSNERDLRVEETFQTQATRLRSYGLVSLACIELVTVLIMTVLYLGFRIQYCISKGKHGLSPTAACYLAAYVFFTGTGAKMFTKAVPRGFGGSTHVGHRTSVSVALWNGRVGRRTVPSATHEGVGCRTVRSAHSGRRTVPSDPVT